MFNCCTRSKRLTENKLLSDFLLDVNSIEGWEVVSKTIGTPRQASVVYRKKDSEKPGVFTYRGETFVSGDIEDVYHYFENAFGHDRWELLEEFDDRKAVFHWYYDFNPKVRGLGSVVELKGATLEELIAAESATIAASNGGGNSPDRTIVTALTALEDAKEGKISSSTTATENSTTGGGGAGERSPSISKPRSKSRGRKSDASAAPLDGIRPREFVFQRSTFRLGPGRLCIIADSTEHKLKRKRGLETVRGIVYIMGVKLDKLSDDDRAKLAGVPEAEANAINDSHAAVLAKRLAKEPLTRITFLMSVNPKFSAEEVVRITDNELSDFCGENKVKEFVDGTRQYFESEENKMFQKFRQVASAQIGDAGFGWMEQEKSKHDLQLGTNVQHSTYGHGIVRKFDMKGRIHVAYDSGEVIEHEAKEKDDLRVAVQLGTRIYHGTRGAGTVKQFDEMGRVHVKFDSGEYHRYKQAAWKKKMHEYRLEGVSGALETITISYRDVPDESRERQSRVRFAVGVTTREVLEYLLEYSEDDKSGNIVHQEVLEDISFFHRIRYQHRKMPAPLTDRDFVYDEIWKEVAPLTYLVVNKSVEHPSKPDIPSVVRGKIFVSGYLIEPLFTEDGKDHIAHVTHMLCIDPNGFVPPDAVAAVRAGQLLGAVTDMRAHFWRKTQAKKNVSIVDRRKRNSKRASATSSTLLGGLKRIGSKPDMKSSR